MKFWPSLLLLLSLPLTAAQISSGWYTLPEHQNHELIKHLHQQRNLKSLDPELKDLSALVEATEPSPREKTRWALNDMKTILGLGANGTFGLLSWGGTKLLELQWKKRSIKSANTNENSPQPGPVLAQENKQQWIQKVEEYFRANGLEINNNLKSAAAEFFDLAHASQLIQNQSGWAPSRLRLDLVATVSTNIVPILTRLGTDVRVRLEWFAKKSPATSIASGPPSALAKSLAELISTVTSEIPKAQKRYQKKVKTFKLARIQLGIGLVSDVDVGVASVGGQVATRIYLTKNTAPQLKTSALESGKEIYLKKQNLTREERTYLALQQGKPLKISQLKNIKIKKRRVKRGIKKAFRFARKFSERVERQNQSKKKKWAVNLIKSQYNFSVGGDIGIVGLEARPVLVFEFRRQN